MDLMGPAPFSAISAEVAKEIGSLDRYERRALTRKKFAVRALDAARD